MPLIFPVSSWNPVSQAGGGGGTFNPLSLNPTMWIGGGNIANFILQNTNQITRATDLTTNATHATPINTTLTNCPIILPNGLNNKAIMDFNGTSNYLQTSKAISSILSANAYTVFCVARIDAVTVNQSTSYINDALWGDTQGYVSNFVRGNSTIGAYNWGGGDRSIAQSFNIGSWIISCCRLSSGIRIQINGGTESVNTASTALAVLSGSLMIGTQYNNSAYTFDGQIADFIAFNTALTQENIDRMFGYFAHQWALQSVLPTGHPYKNLAP